MTRGLHLPRCMKLLPITLTAALAGCGAHRTTSPPPPLRPPHPVLGTSYHAATDATITGETAPPAAARKLLDATNELVAAQPKASHAALVEALDRLADALVVVAPDQPKADLRVREAVDQLRISSEHATTHAALVRTALQAAARALRTAPIPGGFDETSIRSLRLREAADAVENAAATLDPDRPLLDQYATVRIALRESTRAVYAALGRPEPAIGVHVTASR